MAPGRRRSPRALIWALLVFSGLVLGPGSKLPSPAGPEEDLVLPLAKFLEPVSAEAEPPLPPEGPREGEPLELAVQETSKTASPTQDSLPKRLNQRGSLVYELDGRKVAEERYVLQRTSQGWVQLQAEGSLSVRVLWANVKWTFTQEVAWDGELRPVSFVLDTKGPWGLGNRRIVAKVEGDVVVVTGGERQETLAVDAPSAFFAGTISTYVLIPALFAVRAQGDRLTLQAVGGGGPGGRGDSSRPLYLEVRTAGALTRAEISGPLDVYEVKIGSLQGELWAHEGEFVAFVSQASPVFRAYRSDLFPNGLGTPARR